MQESTKCGESSDIIIMLKLGGGVNLDNYRTFLLGVTAEALRAKIDRKSAISLQRSHFNPKFQVEGDVPHQ